MKPRDRLALLFTKAAIEISEQIARDAGFSDVAMPAEIRATLGLEMRVGIAGLPLDEVLSLAQESDEDILAFARKQLEPGFRTHPAWVPS